MTAKTSRQTVNNANVRIGDKLIATVHEPIPAYGEQPSLRRSATVGGATVATVTEIQPGRVDRHYVRHIHTDKGTAWNTRGQNVWTLATEADIEAALTSETGHIRPVRAAVERPTANAYGAVPVGPDAKLSPGMVACLWRAAGVAAYKSLNEVGPWLPHAIRYTTQTAAQWAALVERGLVEPGRNWTHNIT